MHLCKRLWEAKINEALLFKVTSRRDVEWRDYSWATASVCVWAHFKLSCWGKCRRHSLLPSPWKPPLFHRQRGRAHLHSESGMWIIPHYLALILLPSVLSTADYNISMEMKTDSVALWCLLIFTYPIYVSFIKPGISRRDTRALLPASPDQDVSISVLEYTQHMAKKRAQGK